MKEKTAQPEHTSVKEMNPWPSYIQDRIVQFERLKEKYNEHLLETQSVELTITLPDGKTVGARSWHTTPYQIAQGISQGLADHTIIAKVNDELWDLDRPFETDCKLQLLKFDDPEAQAVFWHSSAHILGEAMERVYGGCLCYGPPIENGFYYDMFMDNRGVLNEDLTHLQGLFKNIVKEKQPFERLELNLSELEEMFKYNEFKMRILSKMPRSARATVYRCGPLIDLCRGPHVRHTGYIKAAKITKNSCSYWEGNSKAETLQRVYGVSFPDSKQLKEWESFQEEAIKCDHRKLGREQQLFFFNEMSPGSCFFQYHGTHIYNTLVNFIRDEYRKKGFQEVITPNIYNIDLWKTSDHWKYYGENMFCFDIEKEKFALKPMNCPGHCLIFSSRNRSWRELPLRMADFGVLHRNELSGALTGLTRVRRFQQDDAHIFCTYEQIQSEVLGALNFLKDVYSIFGFTFNLCLSTRPPNFSGEIDKWTIAEQSLTDSLNNFGQPWTINPDDGAFYGPKIDITILDALKRPHQCATIQLDFQLPIKFKLSYINEAGEKTRPVIIHRAVLGSVERMIAILLESYKGKWPFWLSPRQAIVIPVGPSIDEYAVEVRDRIFKAGFMIEINVDHSVTLNRKIRNAQLEQFNFILVVGEKEKSSGTVNVRTRDNKVHGEFEIEELMKKFQKLKETKVRSCDEDF